MARMGPGPWASTRKKASTTRQKTKTMYATESEVFTSPPYNLSQHFLAQLVYLLLSSTDPEGGCRGCAPLPRKFSLHYWCLFRDSFSAKYPKFRGSLRTPERDSWCCVQVMHPLPEYPLSSLPDFSAIYCLCVLLL